MNKEVVVKTKKANLPTVSADQAAIMGEFDYGAVESKDLKIPKLLLMQAMSKFVNEDNTAKAGDLVNSIDSAVYGSVREKDYKPIKVVVIDMYKDWVIHERLGGDKVEYKGREAVTPANTDSPWEYEEGGRKFKRTKNLNFYVMLEKDLGNPLALPHVLTFRSTSYKEGTVIANHFALCKTAKAAGQFRIPMDRFFEIGGKIMKNEKGTFYVLTAKEMDKTTQEQMSQCMDWYRQISAARKAGQAMEDKVDTSDVATPVESSDDEPTEF